MSLIELKITSLIPTRAGCAIFLEAGEKVTQFFIENSIGQAINDHLAGETYERPMTYDMTTALLTSFGARLESLVISEFKASDEGDEIFYATMIWEMSNEIEHRKVVEIDCRPSDGIALAVRQKVPIMVESRVWDQAVDRSELLEELKGQMEEGF